MSHVLLNLLAGPQTLLASPRTPPAGPRTPQNDPQGLRANQQGLRISQYGSENQPKKDGQTDGQTDRQTYGISPHFTDFVPCRGRCHATLCSFTISTKQGKGTAILMMPFGVFLLLLFLVLGTIFRLSLMEF